MRQTGGVLVLVGVVGFFYCGSRLSETPAVRERADLVEALHEPAGRWEVGRYASAFVGATGSVLLLFTRRR
jgi:hypothetical protein